MIKLNPNSRDAFFNRSLSKNELEDMAGAIEDLTKVINLNNKDHKAYERRAYFYYKIGQFIDAIKDLDKAIKIKPNVYALN